MPSTPFDEHFRRHVLPRLERLVRAQAYLVQVEASSFTEAHRAVMFHAVRAGAAHLSGGKLFELREWVTDTLSAAIEAPPLEGSLGREQAVRLWQSLNHLCRSDDTDLTEEPTPPPRGN